MNKRLWRIMQDKIKQALLNHNSQVPRYTSYPPANFFTESPPSDLYPSWLSALAQETPLSLYLHIPFCPQMCWFCGCHTRATTRYAPVHDYLDLLKQEIKMIANCMAPEHPIQHIHFGGGSPTMLTPNDFTSLMNTVKSHFRVIDDCQIAIEIDPRQIDQNKIKTYAENGVQRISIGVQDIHENVMRAINRVQSFSVVERAVDICRIQGINKINVDLVYGLPHQTISTMRETVTRVLELDPDRLSLFGYAHVPWMKKHMRLIPSEYLPDDTTRYDLFTVATKIIEGHGYQAIGIDHFSRSDDELSISLKNHTLSRNFQGYIPQRENLPIIGFGASAISSLPNGYMQNLADASLYRDIVKTGKLPVHRYHSFTDQDKIRTRIIEELMCYQEVDLDDIHQEFGIDLGQLEPACQQLEPLVRDGLVSFQEGYKIRIHSRLAVRLVAAAFDTYRIVTTAPRHASAI